jgi:hypothetical protein
MIRVGCNASRWFALALGGLAACYEPHEERARRGDPMSSAVALTTTAAAEGTSAATTAETSPAAAPARPLPTNDGWLRERAAGTPLEAWLDRAEAHRVQVMVRVRDGACFVEHGFRVDAEYIYPASALKTLLSVVALRRMRALDPPEGLDATLGPDPPGEGSATLGGEIRKLQVVSDNESFARLYDFVGHREVNETLWQLGFTSARFHHRMGGSREAGLATPALRLGAIAIPARKSALVLPPTPAASLELGKAYLVQGKRIERPMSFAEKNYVSLRDLQRVNLSLVAPECEGAVDLGLHESDRAFLLSAMSEVPTAHDPPHDAADEAIEQHKPLLLGVRRAIPGARLRYLGKAGRAYGFHIANEYIEDVASRRAVLVTAAIYANPDGVMNDDLYDYDGSTQPFMRALGELLARAVLVRPDRP